MTSERPSTATGNVMFDLAPSLRVNVWLTGNAEADAGALASSVAAIRGWLAHDAKTRIGLGMLTDEERAAQPQPPPRQQQNNQRPQQGRRPQGGGGQRRGGGGQGTSRTERFQKYDGESCDVCGGDVGIYPRTGNMQTDKLVCLGKCKDGDYVHTVRWLDEEEMPF